MATELTEAQQEVVKYENRRQAVRARFKSLRYGAQQECSYDTREAATTVSSVINGRIISEKVLAKLEGWLDQHESGWRP